jgi:hypothetical protein
MRLAWFMGFLYSYHLAFYPNVEISVSKNWINIIFWFGQGLVSQYFLLHFSNEQEQER